MLQFIYIFHIKITLDKISPNIKQCTSLTLDQYKYCKGFIQHLYIVSPYSYRNCCCMFHITPRHITPVHCLTLFWKELLYVSHHTYSPRHHHTCILSHLTSTGTGNFMFHITPTHQYTCILSHLTSTGTGNYIFHIKQSSHLTPVRCPHSWPSSVAAGLHWYRAQGTRQSHPLHCPL